MKLYARPGSFAAQKVLVVSQYAGTKGLSVVTNMTEQQLKGKAAADRLPLLETDKGFLFESNAIARYLAAGNKALLGADAFEAAQVDAWVDFCTQELEVPSVVVTYPIIGWAENQPDVVAHGLKDLKAALAVLENHLKLETFLVGRHVTLADVCCAAALVLPFKLVLDDKERKALTNVTRWFETVVNQPQFLAVVGPVTLVKAAVKAPAAAAKPATAPAKPAAAPAKPAAAPAKADKPAKAAAKPKKEEEDDDDGGDDMAQFEEKKKPNPLDSLPKSTMVLDEWKRTYSNAPDHDYYKAMPWFWQNVDLNGYSIYRATYQYNGELKVDFQVSNLVSGFVQRCDEVRKYAFGNINIVGKNGGPMEVCGMWLIRGPDITPMMEANPDAEYYTWTKLNDTLTPEIKKEVEDMWCACEQVYGKPILDSKIFK